MRNLALVQSETHAQVAQLVARIETIRATARDAGRAESDSERADIERLLAEAQGARAALRRRESDDQMARTLQGLVPFDASSASGLGPSSHLSLGTQFVRSSAYEFIKQTKGARPRTWQSPVAELAWPTAGLHAATLTGDPASGGDLVVPDTRPGIIPGATRKLTVAQLMASGTTDSNLITYMVEKSFVNAADTVAEGAVKPESTLTFDAVSDPVRKIAHWLPITEEMLEDVAYIRSYIDSRLRLGVQLVEDEQLLTGSTTAPDIIGIRSRTGLAPAIVQGAAPDSAADAVLRQIMQIANTAMLVPDGLVMNPADWAALAGMKLATGEYVGDGPFSAPSAPMLWGLSVSVTPAIPAKTVLVGAFGTAAQVFRKGGIRVDVSNSHQDFFIKNLVAIRAEERLALAVYRPGAFGEVTLL